MPLFKRNQNKDYGKPKPFKNVSGDENKSSKLKIENQSEDKIIGSIRNLFKLETENEAIKDRIVRDIKTFFEQEEEDYYKPKSIGFFHNNYYLELERNDDININLEIK